MSTTAEAITLFVFAFLAIVPTVAAYGLTAGRQVLSGVAAIGWLVMGIYAYQNTGGEWDIMYGLFFFSMGMVIVLTLTAYSLREKRELDANPNEYEDSDMRLIEMEDEEDRRITKRSIPRISKGKTRKPKESKFSKSGLI
jgi:hypothetical protein